MPTRIVIPSINKYRVMEIPMKIPKEAFFFGSTLFLELKISPVIKEKIAKIFINIEISDINFIRPLIL